MDHRRRRLIDYPRSRRRIGHGPRSSARKQSHSESRCGRDYKDFAHSKRSPGARWFEPKTKTKPEGLPEGHEPRAPIRLGSEGGVSRDVRFGSEADVAAGWVGPFGAISGAPPSRGHGKWEDSVPSARDHPPRGLANAQPS
jgi:hypothetical protein